MTPVSIVIPVHNGCALLKKLLQSIAGQTAGPQEIIVVDNGSTDGAAEAARTAGARVIAMGRNTGFAAAVNRGIQEATGQAIALINSDVVLDSRWLEVLWGTMANASAQFATGAILQDSANDTLDGSFDLISRGGTAWRAGAGHAVSSLSQPLTIRFCSATAAIYQSELFRKVGRFEESFESYLEDIDFGLRCAAAGFEGVYVPAATCVHAGSATFGRWNPRVVRLISRNQVFLVARHYPRGLILRWLWPIVVAHLLWAGLAMRHGCFIAWSRGKLEGLWRAPSMGTVPGCESLASILADSERQIYELQSRNGFDAYWRIYFALAGRTR